MFSAREESFVRHRMATALLPRQSDQCQQFRSEHHPNSKSSIHPCSSLQMKHRLHEFYDHTDSGQKSAYEPSIIVQRMSPSTTLYSCRSENRVDPGAKTAVKKSNNASQNSRVTFNMTCAKTQSTEYVSQRLDEEQKSAVEEKEQKAAVEDEEQKAAVEEEEQKAAVEEEKQKAAVEEEEQKSAVEEPIRNSSKVTVSYGDLITNPMSTVHFRRKENIRKLLVTNLSTETIMWTLKADAVCKLNAIPARGILHTGEQQAIVISNIDNEVAVDSCRPIQVHSHIAIDYAFVVPWTLSFDKNFFNSVEKRRHIFKVIFDQ